MNGFGASLAKSLQNIALWLVPVGVGFDWWDDQIPPGYILAYGQDISPSQYPKLHAMWSRGGVHKYGAGAGPATKAPDKRGRHSVGRDDMGGTAASRVTSGLSGINGAALGAVGGDERLHQHLHTATQGGHAHGVNLYGDSSNSGVFAAGNSFDSSGLDSVFTADGSIQLLGVGFTDSNSAGAITVNNTGAGASQNMTPSIVCNYIIRAG